jgi:hypothetical protein
VICSPKEEFNRKVESSELMKLCVTCGQPTDCVITNIRTGRDHCHACIRPTFLKWFVLTCEDVRFLRAIGVDPEVTSIEEHIKRSE